MIRAAQCVVVISAPSCLSHIVRLAEEVLDRRTEPKKEMLAIDGENLRGMPNGFH
jgi:hypothetical protein